MFAIINYRKSIRRKDRTRQGQCYIKQIVRKGKWWYENQNNTTRQDKNGES